MKLLLICQHVLGLHRDQGVAFLRRNLEIGSSSRPWLPTISELACSYPSSRRSWLTCCTSPWSTARPRAVWRPSVLNFCSSFSRWKKDPWPLRFWWSFACLQWRLSPALWLYTYIAGPETGGSPKILCPATSSSCSCYCYCLRLSLAKFAGQHSFLVFLALEVYWGILQTY